MSYRLKHETPKAELPVSLDMYIAGQSNSLETTGWLVRSSNTIKEYHRAYGLMSTVALNQSDVLVGGGLVQLIFMVYLRFVRKPDKNNLIQ